MRKVWDVIKKKLMTFWVVGLLAITCCADDLLVDFEDAGAEKYFDKPVEYAQNINGRALSVSSSQIMRMGLSEEMSAFSFWLKPVWGWNDGSKHYLAKVYFADGLRVELIKDDRNWLLGLVRQGKKRREFSAQLDWQAGTQHNIMLSWNENDNILSIYADGRRVIQGDVNFVDNFAFDGKKVEFGDWANPLYAQIDNVRFSSRSYSGEYADDIRLEYRRKKLEEFLQNNPQAFEDVKYRTAGADELSQLERRAVTVLNTRWAQKNDIDTDSIFLKAVSSLDKIRPEPFLNEVEWSNSISLHGCRGQIATGQFVVLPEKMKAADYEITVTSLQGPVVIPADKLRLRKVSAVMVPAENNYPTGDFNQHFPDALLPSEKVEKLTGQTLTNFWLDTEIDHGQTAGKYAGRIIVSNGNSKVELPISLEVYPITLPKRKTLRTSFGFTPSFLGRVMRIAGDELAAMSDKYVKNMLEHHMTPKSFLRNDDELVFMAEVFRKNGETLGMTLDDLPDEKLLWQADAEFLRPRYMVDENGDYQIDFTQYDQQVERYLDHGLNTILVNTRKWAGKYITGKSNYNLVRWMALPGSDQIRKIEIEPFSDEYFKLANQTFATWEEHLKQKDWPVTPFSYFYDEPSPNVFDNSKIMCELINKQSPSTKYMITFHMDPTDAVGELDVYTMRHDLVTKTIVEQCQKSPQELWLYSCVSPERPYPGVMITHSGVDNLLAGWLCWRFGATGFLYYEVNIYLSPDPMRQPIAWSSLRRKGGLGWGDGLLFYPGPDGPIDSIRSELLRLGIEDYELFVMLRDKIESAKQSGVAIDSNIEQLLDLNNDIQWTNRYRRDSRFYEQRRLEVMRAICNLQ